MRLQHTGRNRELAARDLADTAPPGLLDTNAPGCVAVALHTSRTATGAAGMLTEVLPADVRHAEEMLAELVEGRVTGRATRYDWEQWLRQHVPEFELPKGLGHRHRVGCRVDGRDLRRPGPVSDTRTPDMENASAGW